MYKIIFIEESLILCITKKYNKEVMFIFKELYDKFLYLIYSVSGEFEIPIWEKYTLSIEEAAEYFRIGENKLRRIISKDKFADFILWNGNRAQIKRKLFEKYIDKLNYI